MNTMTAIEICIRFKPLPQSEITPAWALLPPVIRPLHSSSTEFSFDKVCPPQTSNKKLYESHCVKLLDHWLKGGNSNIMCYGQTNSGKTYTMLGGQTQTGLVQLFFKDLMKRAAQWQQSKVFISYVEIYQQKVYDLLGQSALPLQVQLDSEKDFTVKSLQLQTTSLKQLHEALAKGQTNRHYRQKSVLHRSSRSHVILNLTMQRQKLTEKGFQKVENTFQLVDLAGSQRLGDSCLSELKEGVKINQSLLTLVKVVYKLSQGSKHIPYRESILTKLLKRSISKSGRSMIVITCSLSRQNFAQTENSLSFANRATRIKRVPERSDFSGNISKSSLQSQLSRLRQQLRECKKANQELRTQKQNSQEVFQRTWIEPGKNQKQNMARLFSLHTYDFYALSSLHSHSVRGNQFFRSEFNQLKQQYEQQRRAQQELFCCTYEQLLVSLQDKTLIESWRSLVKFSRLPLLAKKAMMLQFLESKQITQRTAGLLLTQINNEKRGKWRVRGLDCRKDKRIGVQLSNLFQDVQAGVNHNLAFLNNIVTLWGRQLTAPQIQTYNFRLIVKAVAAGGKHSLALDQQGSVFAWGQNACGQLGVADTFDRPNPTPVELQQAVQKIYAGFQTSGAISQGGEAFLWGCSLDYRLFSKQKCNMKSPRRVREGVKALSLGVNHSGLIDEKETAWVVGNCTYGQLGTQPLEIAEVQQLLNQQGADSSIQYQYFCPKEVKISERVKQLICADCCTFVLLHSGQLFACGRGSFSRLGLSTGNSQFKLKKMCQKVSEVRGGYRHGFLKSGLQWFGWGFNFYGQLGVKESQIVGYCKVEGGQERQYRCGLFHSLELQPVQM